MWKLREIRGLFVPNDLWVGVYIKPVYTEGPDAVKSKPVQQREVWTGETGNGYGDTSPILCPLVLKAFQQPVSLIGSHNKKGYHNKIIILRYHLVSILSV